MVSSVDHVIGRLCHSEHLEVDRLNCTYLCLSGFALMAGDANLVKEAVQLANDGVDLL